MYTWNLPCDRLGVLSISSILPQILPQTSSQTQGKQRVSRMEHQTPSVFPGNFRKRKVLGTLCFPFCFPENCAQPNGHLARLLVKVPEAVDVAQALALPPRELERDALGHVLVRVIVGAGVQKKWDVSGAV